MSVEYAFNPAAAQLAEDLHALYAARHAEAANRLASPDTSLVSRLHVSVSELPLAQLTAMGIPVETNYLRATPAKTMESIVNAMRAEKNRDSRAAMRLAAITVREEEPMVEKLQALCSLAVMVGGSKADGLSKKDILRSNSKQEADLAVQVGVAAFERHALPPAEEEAISRNLARRKMNSTFYDPERGAKTVALVNRLALSRYSNMVLSGLFAEDASRDAFANEFDASTGLAPKPRKVHQAAGVPMYPVDQLLSPAESGSARPPEPSPDTAAAQNETAPEDPAAQHFSYRSHWQEAVGASWNGSYIEHVVGQEAVGFAGYRVLYLPDTYNGQPIEDGVAVHPAWGKAMYIFRGEQGVDPTTGDVVLTPQDVFLHARQRRATLALGAIRLVHYDFSVYEKAMDVLTAPRTPR